jgi:hypothetical protein
VGESLERDARAIGHEAFDRVGEWQQHVRKPSRSDADVPRPRSGRGEDRLRMQVVG